MRLDKALVEREITPTRAKAQDAIIAGRVKVNDVVVTKKNVIVNDDDILSLQEETLSFVSRAGFKLYDVLEPFDISIKDRIVMDVGASTGGFSDVCLSGGATYVYALDVGSDQMASQLLKNPRLENREHVNCRYLTPDMFERDIDFACMDVSFISCKLIIPAVIACMKTVELVVLVKPQFEAGKAFINKHGIVKEPKVHERVLKDMCEFISSLDLYVHHIKKSSVVGRDGNQEYVFHIKDSVCDKVFDFTEIMQANITVR